MNKFILDVRELSQKEKSDIRLALDSRIFLGDYDYLVIIKLPRGIIVDGIYHVPDDLPLAVITIEELLERVSESIRS